MRSEQMGFGDFPYTDDFAFGGQGTFDFGASPSHSREDAERRRRHQEEEAAREKRRREQKQREEAERKERERRERARADEQRRASGAREAGWTWETPFVVLGVSSASGEQECRRAWRALVIKFHPDKKGGDTRKTQDVNRAWDMLRTRNGWTK